MNHFKSTLSLLVGMSLLFTAENLSAQDHQQERSFTEQDTLRGSITPERKWWDLDYYHLETEVNLTDSTISGVNTIQYVVLEPYQRMQIDLQEPMQITNVTQNGQSLSFERNGSAYFIELTRQQKKGGLYTVKVYYAGQPKVAVRPPWDGGFTWTRDSHGKPFVATSNQGIGASVWWPNKDHPYDEPDSMLISITTPDSLMDVSNGRLRSVEEPGDGTKTWHWFVSNPINNYGVNINIGDYVHFGEEYDGVKGELDLDYYVLRENLEKARKQFQQVKPMMDAFEYWFGPYPFYEDGYKLVEAPYLGMEHQSSVTYGNDYANGYRGRDLSGSGWGMKFDFIIIHESGHEWFANNITYADVADMWIHESFTNYSESLYLDYHYGEEAANAYVKGIRLGILNDRPIIGYYDVNKRGSGDMYNKGGNLLHTLRQVADDDSLWRATLRGLNTTFYHQTVTTGEVETFISDKLNRDLTSVFDQYLRDTRIPTLEYGIRNGTLKYRWGNAVPGFDLPIDIQLGDEWQRIYPVTAWQEMPVDESIHTLRVDSNYYVATANLLGKE